MSKKIIIILVLIVVAAIGIAVYNSWNRKKNAELAVAQFQQETTSGSGLLGYFTNLWNKNQSDGGLSMDEAKDVSKQIADLMEIESEDATKQAQTLIADLYAKGWTYNGYNDVTPVS